MTTPTKARPILFNSAMVRAILDGRKTQTRRILKDQIDPPGIFQMAAAGYCEIVNEHGVHIQGFHCSYGVPGQRLWVREGWQYANYPDDRYYPDGSVLYRADYLYEPHGKPKQKDPRWQWRSSMYMPRAASRITLEITGIRVERLQEISEADARAEGATHSSAEGKPPHGGWSHDKKHWYPSARKSFHALWDRINELGRWASNPWVWVIEFRRIEP